MSAVKTYVPTMSGPTPDSAKAEYLMAPVVAQIEGHVPGVGPATARLLAGDGVNTNTS